MKPDRELARRFLLMALALAGLLLGSQSASAQDARSKLRKLQEDRSKLLDDIVERMREPFMAGNFTQEQMIISYREAFRARFELAATAPERKKALDQFKQRAANMLQIVEARFQVGQVTQLEVVKARAFVLEAEIEVLKEKEQPK